MLLTILPVAVLALLQGADPGHTFRVKVVNASPYAIREVYACPTGASKWGGNLLAQAPLKPGERATVTVRGACGSYDLRLVAENGTEFLDEELEFCDDDDVLTVGEDRLSRTRAVKKPQD